MSNSICFETAADLTVAIKDNVRELRAEANRRKRRELRRHIFSQLWYRDYFLHESQQPQQLIT